jgi:hypothetical protein
MALRYGAKTLLALPAWSGSALRTLALGVAGDRTAEPEFPPYTLFAFRIADLTAGPHQAVFFTCCPNCFWIIGVALSCSNRRFNNGRCREHGNEQQERREKS